MAPSTSPLAKVSYSCDTIHGERFIVDVIRGVGPPFNPQAVTAEFAALLRQYGVSKVTGDNYSAEWVTQAFRNCSVTYERSEKSALQLYLEALPSFARGAISLPDHAPLIRELRGLERRTSRAGRGQVSHAPAGKPR
jgi:hypothetical protein